MTQYDYLLDALEITRGAPKSRFLGKKWPFLQKNEVHHVKVQHYLVRIR